eukprot:33570-Chlamydomonas_euryale.AAC.2
MHPSGRCEQIAHVQERSSTHGIQGTHGANAPPNHHHHGIQGTHRANAPPPPPPRFSRDAPRQCSPPPPPRFSRDAPRQCPPHPHHTATVSVTLSCLHALTSKHSATYSQLN